MADVVVSYDSDIAKVLRDHERMTRFLQLQKSFGRKSLIFNAQSG